MEKVSIYTDGSRLSHANICPSPGGWAFILIHGDQIHRHTAPIMVADHNASELFAVIKALEKVPSHVNEINLFSDSEYVSNFRYLEEWKRNDWHHVRKKKRKITNRPLWERFSLLSRDKNIIFNRTPKRKSQNIRLCDTLAKQSMMRILGELCLEAAKRLQVEFV